MEILMKFRSQFSLKRLVRAAVFLMASVSVVFAQKSPPATRLWSVGPLTKSEPSDGHRVRRWRCGSHNSTRENCRTATQIFGAKNRSVVFAGDRVVLASNVGMGRVEGAQAPEHVYRLLSLDSNTGKVKDSREFLAFRYTPGVRDE